MHCSSKNGFHLKVVNDEYVSRSTGAENNRENDHSPNRNKHKIELNEKEYIMTSVCCDVIMYKHFVFVYYLCFDVISNK